MDVLIVLLLVAQVACDWVEIAQQPYKPVKPTHSHPLLAAVSEVIEKQPEETSTVKSKLYSNVTLPENNWNKATILRVPNVGNIKRIPAKIAAVRTPTNINKATSYFPETTTVEDGKLKVDYKHTHSPLKTLDEPKPEFVTKVKNFRDEYDIKNQYSTQNIEKDSEIVIEKTLGEVEKSNKETIDTTKQEDTKYSNGTDDNEEHEEIVGQRESKTKIDENASKDTKSDVMKNLLAFLSVVTQTISKNTQRSFKSKLRYLEDLKDTILENIESRIDAMWPDEEIEESAPRAARSVARQGGPDGEAQRAAARSVARQGGPDGEAQPAASRSVARQGGPDGEAQPAASRSPVEFPSSESSLMTISFLTFAVFLIKLVLQVIVTYKGNSMMVTPAVMAVGRAASHVAKKQPRH